MPPLSTYAGDRRRLAGLAGGLVLLAVVVFASVAIGTRPVPLSSVVQAVLHHPVTEDEVLIRQLRLPRTALGVAVGAALALAGVLMQVITRNPLADPGLLGVNAGAAAAIVTGIGFATTVSFAASLWLAMAGAATAALLVHVIGARGSEGAVPARLTLVGAAVTAALTAYTSTVLLTDPNTLDAFRFWVVGSLGGHDPRILWQVLPLLMGGIVVGLGLARPLEAIALGDEMATALGARVPVIRVLAVGSITALCGGATAAVGPVAFVGLAVPHLARPLAGSSPKWTMWYALVFGPVLLLSADVAGRVVAHPGEAPVGIITALIGAPVLIALTRRGSGTR